LRRRPFGADEAKLLGVISEIVTRDRVLPRAREIAGRIAQLPPLTASYTRAALTQKLRRVVDESVGYCRRFRHSFRHQRCAHIEPGRDGLFNLIKSVPATLKYEPGVIVADGDFVIVHGRFSGHGRPKSWIAADILRIADGVLVEHWDVLQDEASQAESRSGLPMFGASFTE